MIPKKIHYCWFGPNEMPKDQQAYIAEWKRLMPDYEFKCWSEKDYDIDSTPFTRDAYAAKKYAYVADYIRVYALMAEGGIYMDTDIKLKTRFDPFLKYGMFTSYECAPSRKDMPTVRAMLTEDGRRVRQGECTRIPGIGLFSALIGSEKDHPYIKEVYDYYNTHSFADVWGASLTIPNILAFVAEKYGLLYKNVEQHLEGNMAIFDYTVFASKLHANRHSLAIHYCAASWKKLPLKKRIKGRLYELAPVRWMVNKLCPKM